MKKVLFNEGEYTSPTVELLKVSAEAGFAVSLDFDGDNPPIDSNWGDEDVDEWA